VIPHTELELLGFRSGSTLSQVLLDTSAIILVNNHPYFDNLDLVSISKSSDGPLLIYDFWGRNDHNLSLAGNKQYYSWGNHSKGSFGVGGKN